MRISRPQISQYEPAEFVHGVKVSQETLQADIHIELTSEEKALLEEADTVDGRKKARRFREMLRLAQESIRLKLEAKYPNLRAFSVYLS
jgi:hypothetical protein